MPRNHNSIAKTNPCSTQKIVRGRDIQSAMDSRMNQLGSNEGLMTPQFAVQTIFRSTVDEGESTNHIWPRREVLVEHRIYQDRFDS